MMESDPSSRKQAVTVGYFLLAGIMVLVLQWLLATYNSIETIPYSEFERLVAKGSVTEVAVAQDTIQGKLSDKLPSGKSAFITARVDPALAEKLESKGVVVTGVPSGGLFQTILSWTVPALMFYLIWIFLGRRLADQQGFGGLVSIGKSCQGLCRKGHQGHLRRRSRRRRSEIRTVVAGIEKRSRVLGRDERRRVAYHEMGHALVAANLPGVDPVQKVSIIPRGVGALGYTLQRPTEDRFLLSVRELKNRIAVLMGGRASERLIFDGDVSTGAADDLQRATEIAVEMVTKYGMDAKVGQRTYASRPQTFLQTADTVVSAAELTGREIDLAVRELVEEGDARTRAILEKHRRDLDDGVALLIVRETLTAEEFAPLRPAPARETAAL